MSLLLEPDKSSLSRRKCYFWVQDPWPNGFLSQRQQDLQQRHSPSSLELLGQGAQLSRTSLGDP